MSFSRTSMLESLGARSWCCFLFVSRVSALANFTCISCCAGLSGATFAAASGLR
jgi:hypothetical protein